MAASAAPRPGARVRLFLAGDVMTGRGIDQILPQPSAPGLHETFMRSALGYVELAEAVSGPIGRRLDYSYPWGDALAILSGWAPDARIVNLETAITTSEAAQPDKGIHYRMHPANVACLTRAGLDCCVLANNHVLDWGRAGLLETMSTLRAAGIHWAGAGHDEEESVRPASVVLPHGRRLLVFAVAVCSSGVPREWGAAAGRAGVNLVDVADESSARAVLRAVERQRRAHDIVVLSVHWGGNWGFAIPASHRDFAHALVASGLVDLVHGHSSHHPLGIEVARGKLILYGCGDLINDYEGIGGYQSFQPDLGLMYLPLIGAPGGALEELVLVPVRRRRLRLERANDADRDALVRMLRESGRALGTDVRAREDGTLQLLWGSAGPRRSRDADARQHPGRPPS